MVVIESLRQRLESELQEIENAILDLWRKSRIEEFRNDPHSSIIMFFPPHYWKSLPAEHRAAQARVSARYEHWFGVFSGCYSRHSDDVQHAIKQANEYTISAIALHTDWGTEPTFDGNQKRLAERLGVFRSLLRAGSDGQDQYILIPDTNSLIKSAEPQHYRNIVSSAPFTFVLVPTVLSELDGLKRSREGQSVGEKAEKAIRIIKGMRNQGPTRIGVTVDKTMTVRMIATEPQFGKLPSWLDPSNRDDRILASALEIQFDDPSKTAILVTGDMNLQNKAEMAFLPYAEPPEISVGPKSA
jgi:hypothetical protein